MKTHIGCSIIIYDDHQHVLIAKRSQTKKTNPLLWETVGGALERHETPEQCIRREVKEEINCDIFELSLFNVYVVTETRDRYVLIVYTGQINEHIEFNDEIEEVRWIHKHQITDFEFCGNEDQKLIDYYEQMSQTR